MVNWEKYQNFTKAEFDCKHTGKNEMQPEFLDLLQKLRNLYGQPMIITSGYRDPTHPVEARKALPGTHTYGIACDVACRGPDAFRLVELALSVGFTGVGVNQKGSSRFIHLDIAGHPFFRPTIWSY